jgi:predicted Fe-Mo cluster-binding NifX family protein
MKIAVSATKEDLNAPMDPRFGRCAYFVFVDPENMAFEACPNECADLSTGAGTEAARRVASRGAKVVITGNIGPKAITALAAAQIEVITGQTGTVREAVESYKRGEMKAGSTQEQSVGTAGAGMGMGPGMGRGRGMGRCMGGGMGQNPGRGMGGRRKQR